MREVRGGKKREEEGVRDEIGMREVRGVKERGKKE